MKRLTKLALLAGVLTALAAAPALAQESGDPPGGARIMVGCSGENCWPTYSNRDVDTDIKALKYLLKDQGFADYNANDPNFGPLMIDSVKSFRDSEGLPVNGVVNAPVWEALITPLAAGDRGDSVKAVQIELGEQYNYDLPVTGNYQAQTREAVEDFQSKHGLSKTGETDAATWQSIVGTR